MNTSQSSPPTDAEIVDAIVEYMTERAAQGVKIAQALAEVSIRDGVVTATFDPAKVGIAGGLLHEVTEPKNLAELVGSPLAFDDEAGKRLRQSVIRIDTAYVDGTSLGSLTSGELNEIAVGGLR